MNFQRLANLDMIGYLTGIVHEQRRDVFFLRAENEALKLHSNSLEARLNTILGTQVALRGIDKETQAKVETKTISILCEKVETQSYSSVSF